MNLKKAAKDLDQIFYYILLGTLILYSLMHLFVFILNWEAWFFGMKLDGLDAGILLFAYFLISGSLAYLLFRYPQKISVIALVSVFFFGFSFIDSSVTVQELSYGPDSYSTISAIRVVIPLIVLIGHLIAARFYEREEESGRELNPAFKAPETENPDDNLIRQILILTVAAFVLFIIFGESAIPALILMYLPLVVETTRNDDDSEKNRTENEKQDDYPAAKILVLGLLAFAFVFLFGPLLVSMFFMFFSGLASSVSTPAPIIVGDSLISKVGANGTTEWQTVINGYSDYPQEICSSNDGGYIMAGMFFLGEQSRNLRVMKFNSSGSVIWDINRSVSAYPEVELQSVKRILQTGDEYTVIMLNGIVIRLDEVGNELWHRYYPHEKHIVDSIALPGGEYLLTGDINEDGADGWKKFDGWILCADSNGNTLWEKIDKEFTICSRAVMSPEGYIVLDCYAGCYDPDVACSDPEQSGDMIVALDLQGNYLWKTRFVENIDGEVYSIEPLDNGTIEVHLRGEGEREYILDKEGNVLIQKFLSSQADSYDHDFTLYRKYKAEPVEGNGIRVNVTEADGSGNVFVIDYPENITGISRVFSVNPTPDGGYIVAASENG